MSVHYFNETINKSSARIALIMKDIINLFDLFKVTCRDTLIVPILHLDFHDFYDFTQTGSRVSEDHRALSFFHSYYIFQFPLISPAGAAF